MKHLQDIYHFVRMRLGLPRVALRVWNHQYESGVWDHLEGKAEAEHYKIISTCYQRFCSNRTVLDIGCGNGVLFKYLNQLREFDPANYHGIDISSAAIDVCRQKYRNGRFSCHNYEKNTPGVTIKAGVIIFNESLYYFSKPLQVLAKSYQNNIEADGHFIISMCDYENHNHLWFEIEKHYKCLAFETVSNAKAQKWSVKVFHAGI